MSKFMSQNAYSYKITILYFWADIVTTYYSDGNTDVTNPSGFVHNNSECELDLITSDKNFDLSINLSTVALLTPSLIALFLSG